MRRRGWLSAIPIVPKNKNPCIDEWQKRAANPPDEYELARWASLYPDAGLGFVYGGRENVLGVDLDFLDEEEANRAYARTKSILGPSPLLRIGRYPKRLLLYLYNGVSLPGKNFGSFELFYSSGQTLFFGIHADTGKHYEWALGDPRENGPSDLPEVSHQQVLELIEALRPLQGLKKRAGKRNTLLQANLTFECQTASDRLSGAVAGVLPELQAADDPLQAAIEIVAGAQNGSRYSRAFGVVVTLVKFGYDDSEILHSIFPIYADLFQKPTDRRQHVKALGSALVWARKEIGDDLQALLAQTPIQSLHALWETAASDG